MAGAGKLEMKVSMTKNTGFYIKSAKSVLAGYEDKDGNKTGIRVLSITGSGKAINIAFAVASDIEREGLGAIMKVETSCREIDGKSQDVKHGCPWVNIEINNKKVHIAEQAEDSDCVGAPSKANAESPRDNQMAVLRSRLANTIAELEPYERAVARPGGIMTASYRALSVMEKGSPLCDKDEEIARLRRELSLRKRALTEWQEPTDEKQLKVPSMDEDEGVANSKIAKMSKIRRLRQELEITTELLFEFEQVGDNPQTVVRAPLDLTNIRFDLDEEIDRLTRTIDSNKCGLAIWGSPYQDGD